MFDVAIKCLLTIFPNGIFLVTITQSHVFFTCIAVIAGCCELQLNPLLKPYFITIIVDLCPSCETP